MQLELKYSIRPLILTIFLAFGSQSPATAGELFFGKDDGWVVFQGPILTEEMDEILSQLEDKKPKLILLNSIGGNVLGALRFARYVRQNKMNTWIAENQTCASACALVFLAGIQRFSEGKLVVHQYLPPQSKLTKRLLGMQLGYLFKRIIGETITLLNSFGTPRFVFERIFSSPDLYEFTEAEMAELTTVTSLDEM